MDGSLVMMIKAIAPPKLSKEIYQTAMTYSLFQVLPHHRRHLLKVADAVAGNTLCQRCGSDGVLIWKSGDKTGIYAIAVENFHRINTDCDHWKTLILVRLFTDIFRFYLFK